MPSSPPSVFTPPSAGSPPAAPGAVYSPPSSGSPPSAPGGVFAPPGADGSVVMVKPGSNSGALIPGSPAGGRPTFSTDGTAIAPPSGFWARISYAGGRWTYVEYPNGSGGSVFSANAMAGTQAHPSLATWATGYSVSAWTTPPPSVFTP